MRRGQLWRGQVHHSPYPLQRATLLGLNDELIGAAGLPQPSTPPPLVHYVKGVDVNIHGLQPCGPLNYSMKNEATIKSTTRTPATTRMRRKSAQTYWYSSAYSE